MCAGWRIHRGAGPAGSAEFNSHGGWISILCVRLGGTQSQLARVRAEVVEATAEAACTVAAPPALPASSPSPASASAAADSTDMESLRAQEEDRDLHGTSAAEAAAWTNERMVSGCHADCLLVHGSMVISCPSF